MGRAMEDAHDDELPLDDAQSFFGAPHIHTLWNALVPAEMTTAEVEFLAGQLGGDKAKPRVLDLACGSGRHALGLAAGGFAVTGLDISGAELARLAKAAEKKKLDIKTVERDMRELAEWEVAKPFDGAFCFGNSISYLSADELSDMLTALAGKLAVGAALVLDTSMVAESFLPTFHDQIEIKAADIHLVIDNDYDIEESRVIGDYTFTDAAGVVTTKRYARYCLTTRELIGLVEDAGFEVEHLLEGIDGELYGLGSQRLLLVAHRVD